jgi:hypothetical protein
MNPLIVAALVLAPFALVAGIAIVWLHGYRAGLEAGRKKS